MLTQTCTTSSSFCTAWQYSGALPYAAFLMMFVCLWIGIVYAVSALIRKLI